MIICKQCGQELPDDSLFCSKCGAKVGEAYTEQKIKSNKLTKIIGIGGLLIVIILVFVFMNSNPADNFLDAVQSNNYADAIEIYENKIKGDLEKEKEVETLLKNEIESIKLDFLAEKIDYSTTIVKLETIEKTNLLMSDINSLKTEINRIHDSRTAFKTGQEFLDKDKIREAITEFNKVIEEDKNYSKAQELINDNKSKYKTIAINNAEQYASEGKYIDAISVMNDALIIIPSDSDLLAKKKVYEDENEEKVAAERKKIMDELVENQEVSVVSSKVFKDWIGWDNIEVVVKNNTDKVVKNYTVAWMCFDKDGFPIKTGYGGEDYLDKGIAEHNVQPGKTFGSGYGWNTSENSGAKTVLAVVKEVEYYDGTKWINPYYDHWLEEYLEKPLY